jgi:acetamidase/formamidase
VGGYEATTGIEPDLMEAAPSRAQHDRAAHAQKRHASRDTYILCSVCGELRISEIVDAPSWTVSFYFPRVVLGQVPARDH